MSRMLSKNGLPSAWADWSLVVVSYFVRHCKRKLRANGEKLIPVTKFL
jgi:hypothetical protein